MSFGARFWRSGLAPVFSYRLLLKRLPDADHDGATVRRRESIMLIRPIRAIAASTGRTIIVFSPVLANSASTTTGSVGVKVITPGAIGTCGSGAVTIAVSTLIAADEDNCAEFGATQLNAR